MALVGMFQNCMLIIACCTVSFVLVCINFEMVKLEQNI